MKEKTYLILRITFCIIAALLCAAAVFIFAYFGWWGMICVIAALICAALMMLFKRLQDSEHNKANPPAPAGDFITGKASAKDDGDRQK